MTDTRLVEAALRKLVHAEYPNKTLAEIAEIWGSEAGLTKAEIAALQGSSSEPCEHEWVDARNEFVESGEWCPKCGVIRPGNAVTGKAPDPSPPESGERKPRNWTEGSGWMVRWR